MSEIDYKKLAERIYDLEDKLRQINITCRTLSQDLTDNWEQVRAINNDLRHVRYELNLLRYPDKKLRTERG